MASSSLWTDFTSWADNTAQSVGTTVANAWASKLAANENAAATTATAQAQTAVTAANTSASTGEIMAVVAIVIIIGLALHFARK